MVILDQSNDKKYQSNENIELELKTPGIYFKHIISFNQI